MPTEYVMMLNRVSIFFKYISDRLVPTPVGTSEIKPAMVHSGFKGQQWLQAPNTDKRQSLFSRKTRIQGVER